MSYEGTAATGRRLTTETPQEPFRERGYYLWFGSLTMPNAVNVLWPDQEEVGALNSAVGTEAPRGETMVLGPATITILIAETRNGTHPVDLEYQVLLDNVLTGNALNISTGTTSGSEAQAIAIGSGWHRVAIQATPSAPDGTSSRYGAAVYVVESS